MKEIIGAVHGRFQPLHVEHIEDLFLPALRRCGHLYIGITNFDRNNLLYSKENPHRSLIENNPFTFYERLELIRNSMKFYDISAERFTIIPFPINQPELLDNYISADATHFITIFDDWGRKKVSILKSRGYKVEILSELPLSAKKISATMVRELVLSRGNFKDLVPLPVFNFLSDSSIYERLISYH